jgi:hypothetical protein
VEQGLGLGDPPRDQILRQAEPIGDSLGIGALESMQANDVLPGSVETAPGHQLQQLHGLADPSHRTAIALPRRLGSDSQFGGDLIVAAGLVEVFRDDFQILLATPARGQFQPLTFLAPGESLENRG